MSRSGTGASEQIAGRLCALRRAAERLGPRIAASAPTAIHAAARLLAEDASGLVSAAAANGPAVGLSPEMVREAIANVTRMLDADGLESLSSRLRSIAGSASVQAPRVVFHVLAGNLFVAGIESMVHASLVGACSLVRCSSADPVFPRLWHDALVLADKDFAGTVAVCHWPTEDEAATRCAIDGADCVAASGADASVAAVRALTPTFKRFVGHGSKISVALVGREALRGSELSRTAEALAYDFSVYDQQGCLSPRAAFVESGDATGLETLAQSLCHQMRRIARALPRHALDLHEKAALAGGRDGVIIRAAMGEKCTVASQVGDDFLVTVDRAEGFRLGSLNRHCDLRAFGDADEVRRALAPHIGHISTVGIAGDWKRWRDLCSDLRVSRVCPPGTMQKPPLGWIHDGRLPLVELVDFCGSEF